MHLIFDMRYNIKRMQFNWRTFKKHWKKIKWTKVTWYSKLAALVFFIAVVPVITFTLGAEYQKTLTSLGNSSMLEMSLDGFVPRSHDDQNGMVAITIYKPADAALYAKKIADFESGKFGNKNVIQIMTKDDFVSEQVSVKLPEPYDIVRETANAAAMQVDSEVGPLKVTNFVVENGTAYVELNIDTDGWAGVSFVKDYANPIIRQTLLQFPQITRVIFGPAKFQK